ncbi:MAG: hypothetical protein GWO41_17110 [candidate division Zixibacteria bacterium]|nr:hypothetical protein [candidate division Zixibacteria bacterium]NIR65016.1 hypothetical protein [candidate division Zixibacteria bacterium]NIS18138.1 hypothetical protein [candidate division Zixibacteria bacterium]NIS46801.1 hypothetical protein [candidate division Zixibacteria bacterium]NIT54412.1 hypothetical protein [candidate division Zixibacteria bacterium]
MKRNILKTLSFLALILIFASGLNAKNAPVDKIETAYSENRISLGQKIIYKVMTVRAPERLPDEFRFDTDIKLKSATEIMIEARRNLERLSMPEQEILSNYLGRPNMIFSAVSPEGHFRIHYNLEGAHAVDPSDVDPLNGIPDYVDWIAQYSDSSYSCMHDHLAYSYPPSDDAEGGDSLYDIYLMEMPYYGYTQPESPGPEEWDDWISYMVVHRNFIDFPPNDDPEGLEKGAAKVTCAHEYFHAVQLAYNLLSTVWYMEVSSCWMEEICYPQVNDNYNYLWRFFDYTHLPLNETADYHHYGAFIWNRFLDNYFDTTLIRNVWDNLKYDDDVYTAINTALLDYSSSLYDAFSEFAAWNWCVSIYDDGNHYEQGWDYPVTVDLMGSVTLYPTIVLHPISAKRPDGLAANYIEMTGFGDVIGDFILSFDGQDGYHWKANIILAQPGNNYTFTEIPLNEAYAGSLVVSEIENYDYIVLNPVVKSWYADDLDYIYSADLLPWPDYAAEVKRAGPYDIYSMGPRTVNFWVSNRGSNQDIFHMSIEDEMGWDLQLHDTLFIIPIKDSVMVAADIFSGPDLLPGTVNNIILTATSHKDSSAFGVDSLPLQIVRFNGDSNNDGNINVSDAVWIINFTFVGGDPPRPELYQGDANCDDNINVSDAVFIVNYVFMGGQSPPCLAY